MSKRKNISPTFLKKAILRVLKNRAIVLNTKQIAWELKLKGSEYQKIISKAIKDLKRNNLILELKNHKYQYNAQQKNIIGTIEINRAGHGYVSSKLYDHDIFINRKHRLNALNLDTVSVKIIKNKRLSLHGKIENVIKRNLSKLSGRLEFRKNFFFFVPDNTKSGSVFCVKEVDLGGAEENDRVIAEFLNWPISESFPFVKIIKILPKYPSLKSEINSNIEIFNIRNSFSQKIKKELSAINSNIGAETIKKRKDFRDDITFTIDPDDAKDFDDALSIKFLENQELEVGIHIADVSHYVLPGSEIDKEAFLRSYSVYFPGKVVPMLPEKLSNEICSLRPNEDKLCFSVSVRFSQNLSTIGGGLGWKKHHSL